MQNSMFEFFTWKVNFLLIIETSGYRVSILTTGKNSQ